MRDKITAEPGKPAEPPKVTTEVTAEPGKPATPDKVTIEHEKPEA
jgi:hypothetical protein